MAQTPPEGAFSRLAIIAVLYESLFSTSPSFTKHPVDVYVPKLPPAVFDMMFQEIRQSNTCTYSLSPREWMHRDNVRHPVRLFRAPHAPTVPRLHFLPYVYPPALLHELCQLLHQHIVAVRLESVCLELQSASSWSIRSAQCTAQQRMPAAGSAAAGIQQPKKKRKAR